MVNREWWIFRASSREISCREGLRQPENENSRNSGMKGKMTFWNIKLVFERNPQK
jgi:hypothetical protein